MATEALSMRDIGVQLRGARDFVGVAAIVCEAARARSIAQCTVTLFGSNGIPVLAVDNLELSDHERLTCLMAHSIEDPLLRELQKHHAAVVRGPHGRTCCSRLHTLLLPILELGNLLGSIRCADIVELDPDLQRDLSTLATHVSVRLGELGVTALPDPLLGRLTDRQGEVALLVAKAMTNLEIAAELELSENTVKKHLKDIYTRLKINTRTELATRVRRGQDHEVVPGVSRRQGITIVHIPRP